MYVSKKTEVKKFPDWGGGGGGGGVTKSRKRTEK